MIRANPFAERAPTDSQNQELVTHIQNGSREALELLIKRHQAWIYNVVLRMTYLPQEAEDATQEILIKLMTKLSTFEGRSSFRTWLYRMVVNHVLNMKRARAEQSEWTFKKYGDGLASAPDAELRDNFRQKLTRSRRDLHSFMQDKCELINKANPCRCAKKTQAFMKAGYVDPNKLLFASAHVTRIREVAERRHEYINSLDTTYGEIYRDHPFLDPPDFIASLRKLMDHPDFKSILELGE